jgi:hypothetical protein
VPNIRDKVLLSYREISEIGEIREVRTIHNGDKRYKVVFLDCRGREVSVWRKLSNLKDMNGDPVKE